MAKEKTHKNIELFIQIWKGCKTDKFGKKKIFFIFIAFLKKARRKKQNC